MRKSDRKNQEILVVKFLSGEITPEEIMELRQWLDSSNDNLLYFQQMKNVWDNADNQAVGALINVDKAFSSIKKKVTFKSPDSNFWFYWSRIAAVLLLPLLLGNLFYFFVFPQTRLAYGEPVYNELFAAFGTRSALKLSDGSSVWLNSGSSIKYPDRFTGKDRRVYLKGEAFFEVESNSKKPFIVETDYLSVKATGTKFNVSGYASDELAEVTLVTGKVEVCLADESKNISNTKLEVNQHLSFNKTSGDVSVITEDPYKYISWKEGKLVFRNEPLINVVNEISKVFNIDIELIGNEIRDYSYRATFQDESLEEILKLLKLSSPIDYIEETRNPLPDGSFPRKRVVIFPAKQKK